jgi:hypothetical protein
VTGPASLRLPVAAGVRTLVAGLAIGEPVRVSFREEGALLVVYRVEDASGP